MSVTVTFIDDPFDHKNWKTVETTDLLECLVSQYKSWPVNARLYKGTVSQLTEVTPHDENDIESLKNSEGQYYVVNYPGGAETLLYIALAASVVAAFVFKPKIPNETNRTRSSKSPNNGLSERTNQARPNGRIPDIFGTVRSTPDLIASPFTEYVDSVEVENAIMCIGRGQHEIHDCRDGTTSVFEIDGAEVNIWKPYQDIRGVAPYFQKGSWITEPVFYPYRNDAVNGQTLKATIQQLVRGEEDIKFQSPNRIIINHLGPGSYKTFAGVFTPGQLVTISNARLDDPLLYQHRQSAVTVPTTKPNSIEFEVPDATPPTWIAIGDRIRLVVSPFTYRGTILINGMLFDTNFDIAGEYTVTDLEIRSLPGPPIFYYLIVTLDNPQNVAIDWQNKVPYLIQNRYDEATYDINDAAKIYDVAGQYTVSAIEGAGKEMTLVSPELINPDWLLVGPDDPWLSPVIFNLDSFDWVGDFTASNPNTTELLFNFVGPNGLYGDDGVNIFPLFINVLAEYWPVNAAGAQIGPRVRVNAVVGKLEFDSTDSRGTTLRISGLPPSRYKVRAARETPRLDNQPGTTNYVDEVKWKDFYFGVIASNTNFGNLTIVRSRTRATEGALSLKERRLNCLVTRQINLRVSGSTFTPDLYSTNRADEILAFVAMEPKLGDRPLDNIDFDNIYGTILEANDYFGFQAPIEFCYTFDDELSFEETWQAIANAVFCYGYRQGSLLKLKFEGRTEDSTLLFNHRNKIPGSESRTLTFGPSDEFDGIALSWVNPEDDAVVTRYIPEDRSAKKEKKIETIGVRNEYQSYIHAWRYYQKGLYQNTITKFQATEESELLITSDRILVADNTRPDTQDGEIIDAVGLLLETSQKVIFQAGKTYTLFLQMFDGTIQSMPCFEVVGDPYAVAISTTPRMPLVFSDERYAKTTYTVVADDDPRQTAFMLTDRETGENGVSDVTAVNYDARYYAHDNDLFPPIDRTIYLSSRPYPSFYSDALNPTASISIHSNPNALLKDAQNHEISVEEIILQPIVLKPVLVKDAQNHDIGVEEILLAIQPVISPSDALTPTVTLGVDLATTIFTNAKDALNPTATLSFVKT